MHYFSLDELYVRGNEYLQSFFSSTGFKITADTYGFHNDQMIQRIKEYNPEMKIIALLRDPIERAQSSLQYSINYGHHEERTLLKAFEIERSQELTQNPVEYHNQFHFNAGLYFQHLTP